MQIRRLSPLDAEAYLNFRLVGLKNTPEAFGSSYSEEKDDPIEKYRQRFQSNNSFTLGAFNNSQLLGVVT